MPQDIKERLSTGRRAARERRSCARYPFTAMCEATEPDSGAKSIGRTSDIGRGGCYIDTISTFAKGTHLVVRINREGQTLNLMAQVAFSQPSMGMGLAFTDPDPEQQAILDQWIAELTGEPITKSETAAGSDKREIVNVKEAPGSPLSVVNELILLLLQKGVITEPEGKSLLQKLPK